MANNFMLKKMMTKLTQFTKRLSKKVEKLVHAEFAEETKRTQSNEFQ